MAAFKLLDLYADITAKFDNFNRDLEGVRTRVRAASDAIDRMASRAKWALLGMTASGTGLVYIYANFEQRMKNVQAVLQTSASNMELLTAKARKLGSTTMYTAADVGEAMEAFAKQGFETADILIAVDSAVNLAASGTISMGEAAEYSAGIMRSMQIDSKDLAWVMDVLTTTAAYAAGGVSQYAEALKKVGPVANDSHQSLSDIAAVLGVLGNNMYLGEEAGTALRNILLRMRAPVENSQKELKKLGVSVRDAKTGAFRPFLEVLVDLSEALRGVDEEEGDFALQTLGGTRAIAALSIAINASGGDLEKFRERLANCAGQSERMAKIQMSSLWGKLTRVKTAFYDLAIEIVGKLMPAFDAIIPLVIKATEWVKGMSDASFELKMKLLAIVAGSSILTIVINGLIFVFATLLEPVALVIAGLVSLASYFIYASLEGDTFTEKMQNMGKTLSKLWTWGKSKAIEYFKVVLMGYAFLQAAAQNWRLAFKLAAAIAWQAIVRLINGIQFFFTDQLPNLLKWFGRNWAQIFTDIANFTETVFSNMAENISEFCWQIMAQLESAFTRPWNFKWKGLTEGFQSTLSEMPKLLDRPLTEYEKKLAASIGRMKSQFGLAVAVNYMKLLVEFGLLSKKMKEKVEEDLDKANKAGEKKKRKSRYGGKREDVFPMAFLGIEEMAVKIQTAVGKDSTNSLLKRQVEQGDEGNGLLTDINTNLAKMSFKPAVGP